MSLNKRLNKLFEKEFKKISEEEIEESNVTGGGEAYDTPKAFKKKKKRKVEESEFKKLSREMFLSEANYRVYKKDESKSQKQKVNKSIQEINGKLFRIERIIDQNVKLKTETGVGNDQYWKGTRTNLNKIRERMIRIAEKIRRF